MIQGSQKSRHIDKRYMSTVQFLKNEWLRYIINSKLQEKFC